MKVILTFSFLFLAFVVLLDKELFNLKANKFIKALGHKDMVKYYKIK